MQTRRAERDAEVLGDLLRQRGMRASRKQLQLARESWPDVVARSPSNHAILVGAEGFEPSNTGSKVPRLTAWPRPICRMIGEGPMTGRPPGSRVPQSGRTCPSQTRKFITGPRAGPPRGGRASGSGSTSQSGRCSARAAALGRGLGKQRRTPPIRCRSSPPPSAPSRRQASTISPNHRDAAAPPAPEVVHEPNRPGRPARHRSPRDGRPASAAPARAILVEPAIRVGRRHAERRLDDDDAEPARRRRPDRARRRGRRRAPCRPGGRTARRSRAPPRAATSSRRGRRASQSAFRPTSAAAASALPPPRPAAAGIAFSSRTCTSRGSPGAPDRPPQQLGRAPDEVRAIGRHAGRARVERRTGPRRVVNRQRVGERDRLHQRPDVVEAVGPARRRRAASG